MRRDTSLRETFVGPVSSTYLEKLRFFGLAFADSEILYLFVWRERMKCEI